MGRSGSATAPSRLEGAVSEAQYFVRNLGLASPHPSECNEARWRPVTSSSAHLSRTRLRSTRFARLSEHGQCRAAVARHISSRSPAPARVLAQDSSPLPPLTGAPVRPASRRLGRSHKRAARVQMEDYPPPRRYSRGAYDHGGRPPPPQRGGGAYDDAAYDRRPPPPGRARDDYDMVDRRGPPRGVYDDAPGGAPPFDREFEGASSRIRGSSRLKPVDALRFAPGPVQAGPNAAARSHH